MAKWANDLAMDAMLDWIAECDTITVCSQQPTTYTEATTTYTLSTGALTPGDGNGSFTIANGDVSGRKLRTLQQLDLDIANTGTATHIALCLSVGSTLRYVTTCTSQPLTSGGKVTIPVWDIEVADPV